MDDKTLRADTDARVSARIAQSEHLRVRARASIEASLELLHRIRASDTTDEVPSPRVADHRTRSGLDHMCDADGSLIGVPPNGQPTTPPR